MFCSCMTSDKQSWTCNSETTRKKNSETTPNNSERIPNPKQPEKKIAPVCGFLRTVCGFFAPVCVFDFLRNVPKLSEIVRKYSEMYSELVSESVRKYPEFYSELVPESVRNKRPLYIHVCPALANEYSATRSGSPTTAPRNSSWNSYMVQNHDSGIHVDLLCHR